MNHLNILLLCINAIFLVMFIIYELNSFIYPQRQIDIHTQMLKKLHNDKKLNSNQKEIAFFHLVYILWVVFGFLTSHLWGIYLIIFILGLLNGLSKPNTVRKVRVDSLLSLILLILITFYEFKELLLYYYA